MPGDLIDYCASCDVIDSFFLSSLQLKTFLIRLNDAVEIHTLVLCFFIFRIILKNTPLNRFLKYYP